MGDPSGTPTSHVGGPSAADQQPSVPAGAAGSPATTSQQLLGAQRQPLPKQLTAAIKSCTSLEQLAQLCQAHAAVLNPIHIAAILTKLPKLDGVGLGPAAGAASSSTNPDGGAWVLPAASAQQQKQLKQLMQQLLSLLRLQGCSEHSPRGVANIVWALAKLQCAPDTELRAMLLDRFCEQLSSSVPQDISNVLWGVAKLTKEHAAVLSAAASSGEEPGSSSAVAEATGQPEVADAAPAAASPLLQQEQVQLMLQHLVRQLPIASVQTISNSLWAVVVLQQEHQWCMCNCLEEVQALLSAFCAQPQQALPAHIQPIVRCMAQLATTCSNHAGPSWVQWQPPMLQKLLDHLSTQRDQLELHHVSSVLRDVAQVVCLQLQLQKQQQQQGATTAFSSTSSVPSMADPSAPAGLEGSSRHGPGGGGISASSSTASSSSMLGSSTSMSVSQPAAGAAAAAAATGTGEEVEEVLVRLAASGGPQDASSTVLALAMLRPQLQLLGLQSGVASLCSMLPAAVLPHLGPEVGQRLLAAASFSDAPPACSPTAVDAAAEDSLDDAPFSLPVSTGFAARIFAQSGEGLPLVSVPLASPGASNSGSSEASPTQGSPIAAAFTGLPTLPQPQLQAEMQARLMALGGAVQPAGSNPGSQVVGVSGSNPGSSNTGMQAGIIGSSNQGHGNPGHSNPGTPQAAAINPHGGLALQAAAPGAGPADAAAAGGDSQEEAAARQLTHNIAYADSVFQLADIFTAHASVMDMIHITACITRLSKVLGTSPSQAAQAAAASLLPQLGNKLLSVLPHANARGIANVLWGYGRLRALPQTQLLPPLVDAFLTQLPNAACRDSAVVLWSLARLSEGQAEPVECSVPPVLLRRLGREILQQLAAASREAPGQPPRPPQPQYPHSVTPRASDAGSKGEGPEGEVSGPPSSRDVSNSLMALARLGFVPQDDTAATATAAASGTATPRVSTDLTGATDTEQPSSAAAGEQQPQPAEQGAAPAVAMQLQGLSLLAPPPPAAALQPPTAGAPASSAGSRADQLTLPLSQIKAVVDYLLKMAATAKTLDLQETATALKQLGLRELHAKVAATVITHHGTAHGPAAAGGGSMMQFGGPGGRMGPMQRPQFGGGQFGGGQFGGGGGYATMLQQQQMQRRPQMPMAAGGMYAGPGGGWAGPGQQQHGGMAGGQFGLGVGYGGPMRPAGGQVLRPPGMAGPQQGYMMAPAGGGGMQGFAAPGFTGVGGIMQQQGSGGGAYAPAVQYLLMPQQQGQQGGYFVQQAGPQQQQGDALMLGMQVMQQPGGDQGPPGLVGAGAGAMGQPAQQQYYVQQPGSAAMLVPAMVMGPESTGGSAGAQQQQLLLQQAGGLGQVGGAGGGYPGADVITSTAYSAPGDLFLLAPQQHKPSSQLQLLQSQQAGQTADLFQQPQQQMAPGFQSQDAGAVYLQQQQQMAVMYGMGGQQQPQQQQFGSAGAAPGTLVLDPTTGLYHLQQ